MKNVILKGDVLEKLKELPDGMVNTCITSPPYWGLRDYDVENQIGTEDTPEKYVNKIADVFDDVKRVLRDDGTLWLNLGDSYFGSWGNYSPHGTGGQREKSTERFARKAYEGRENWRPPTSFKHEFLKKKDLVGVPWRVAFELQKRGWFLRSDIVWNKPNPTPSSVKDRPNTSHEYIFLLSKSRFYYYDSDSIKEPTVDGVSKRNKRTVWEVPVSRFRGAHFATFPPELIEPCVIAGSPENGLILDPFFGSGTTGLVAKNNNRNYIGIELNENYAEIAERRISENNGN
jgi:site-specific DNA-methyltransferase (cytosine-N4-specific)